ncbi:MAG: flavodoxin family protein [Candidatus Thorarchaeota archaeon]
MTRALILYHSLYGNTKLVAISLAKGIEESGIETTCRSIEDFDIDKIMTFDFIAIGSPTHMLRPSKPMKEFLQKLKAFNLSGKVGFCFDTRNESKMNKRSYLILENSAARGIEGLMKRMKIKLIQPRQSAIVEGREGPLNQGVESMFFKIGSEIGNSIITQLETV